MELFISDLDGTLLNGNAEVTEFTRDTLNRLCLLYTSDAADD